MTAAPLALLTSSTEGRTIARDLRTRLDDSLQIILWDEGVIRPGRAAWDDLIETCKRIDLGLLLLTADDVVERRGHRFSVPRDNLVFEAGLLMGLLGPERALLVQQDGVDLRLPSDLEGITRIRYPAPTSAADSRGSLDRAAREIERSMASLGRRIPDVPPSADHRRALNDEVDMLCRAATARGWIVASRTTSILCLRYVGRRPIELRLGLVEPLAARHELRHVAEALHKLGVRVANGLLPVQQRGQ